VDGTSHFVMLDKLATFTDLLTSFLRKQEIRKPERSFRIPGAIARQATGHWRFAAFVPSSTNLPVFKT
jgi:hypothetical protein